MRWCLPESVLFGWSIQKGGEWRGDKEGRNEDEEMIRREKREGVEKDRG